MAVESKKGNGLRRSPSEWRSLLAECSGSGLGAKAFCWREGISAASLYRWRKRLASEGDCRRDRIGDTAPTFVDLGTLTSAASSKPRIELKLHLGDGLVLHLVRS